MSNEGIVQRLRARADKIANDLPDVVVGFDAAMELHALYVEAARTIEALSERLSTPAVALQPSDEYAVSAAGEAPRQRGSWVVGRTADVNGVSDLIVEGDHGWCVWDIEEDDPPICERLPKSAAQMIAEGLNLREAALVVIERDEGEF